METKSSGEKSYVSESVYALTQEERFRILDAQFLTAGILLEVDGIAEWTPSQAGDKVREIRANFEEGLEIDDSDIRSGVGYTAISHLVADGKVAGRKSPENEYVTIYHVVPQKPEIAF